MKKNVSWIIACAVAAAALVGLLPAQAQYAPGGAVQSIAPMTRDLGAVVTLAAQVPGTVNSADQNGFNVTRVICVANIATKVGSSTLTFKLQNKDAASGLYYDLLSSGTITAAATPTFIAAGAGLFTTTNVSAAYPIAKTWRVSSTVGTATSLTGTIGCSVQ